MQSCMSVVKKARTLALAINRILGAKSQGLTQTVFGLHHGHSRLRMLFIRRPDIGNAHTAQHLAGFVIEHIGPIV